MIRAFELFGVKSMKGIFAKEKIEKYSWIIYYLIIVFVAVLFVGSVYPAEIPDDTTNILNDLFHHDRWRDWHPVTYYIFIKSSMYLIRSTHMVVLAQTVLFLIAQFQIVRYIHLYCKKQVQMIYLFTTLIVGFAGFEYLVILQKDAPYTYGFLGVTITLMYCIKEKGRTFRLIELFIWCAITSAMRHMGWLSIALGIVILAIVMIRNEKSKWSLRILIAAVIGIILTLSVREYMVARYDIVKPPKYVTYTMPLYMLGAYTESKYDLDEKIVEVLEEVMPVEKWNSCYNEDQFFADHLSRDTVVNEGYIFNVDEKNLYGKVIYCNARFFVRHPIDYCYKLFRMNSLVWSISTPKGGYVGGMYPGFSGAYLNEQFPEWNAREAFSSGLVYPIVEFMIQTPMKNIVHRGGLVFWAMIVCIIVLCRKKKVATAMVLAPVMFLNIMMMLSIPQQDPRYVLPEIVVGCIVPVLLGEKEKKEN